MNAVVHETSFLQTLSAMDYTTSQPWTYTNPVIKQYAESAIGYRFGSISCMACSFALSMKQEIVPPDPPSVVEMEAGTDLTETTGAGRMSPSFLSSSTSSSFSGSGTCSVGGLSMSVLDSEDRDISSMNDIVLRDLSKELVGVVLAETVVEGMGTLWIVGEGAGDMMYDFLSA